MIWTLLWIKHLKWKFSISYLSLATAIGRYVLSQFNYEHFYSRSPTYQISKEKHPKRWLTDIGIGKTERRTMSGREGKKRVVRWSIGGGGGGEELLKRLERPHPVFGGKRNQEGRLEHWWQGCGEDQTSQLSGAPLSGGNSTVSPVLNEAISFDLEFWTLWSWSLLF